jgi:hypothetical protein
MYSVITMPDLTDCSDTVTTQLPCSRVLPEKPTSSQLVKKFPAFYGTRRFITTFTTACHLSLSWATVIQSMPPHPTSWRPIFNIILQSPPRSSKWSPSLRFPDQNPVWTSPVPHTCHMLHPSLSSWFDHPMIFGEKYRALSSSLYSGRPGKVNNLILVQYCPKK